MGLVPMKRTASLILVVAVSIFTASSALARHNHKWFCDWCKMVTIEGRIESVEWKNPHIHVVVEMNDGTSYTAELSSPDNLASQGTADAAKAALTVGARITLM
jgi:Family of unknown function (DUF6152)